MKSVDEGDRADDALLSGLARELLGISHIRGERLLADHVNSGLDGRARKIEVHVIRRAHVKHVDSRVQKVVDAGEGALGSEGIASTSRAGERRGRDTDERSTCCMRRPSVDGTHETRPHDADAERGGCDGDGLRGRLGGFFEHSPSMKGLLARVKQKLFRFVD
ncbi:hypothetical protein GCM10009777_00540 [Microbacterium pumilum]|uniref:Uncharacterized protein n=1 Tax=Microbacterium pumilum TaxID=344165 RepID=A0ABN2RP33_9MICO